MPNLKKIAVSPLRADEKQIIRAWPPYRHPFEALDYALRDGGWLDHYGNVLGCITLGAHVGGELVGFSLLVPHAAATAEFYVAVKGDRLHEGLGAQICIETLKEGFVRHPINKIFLRVRTNHDVGIKLYGRLGFAMAGQVSEVTNNVMTDFYVMEMTRDRFSEIYGEQGASPVLFSAPKSAHHQ